MRILQFLGKRLLTFRPQHCSSLTDFSWATFSSLLSKSISQTWRTLQVSTSVEVRRTFFTNVARLTTGMVRPSKVWRKAPRQCHTSTWRLHHWAFFRPLEKALCIALSLCIREGKAERIRVICPRLLHPARHKSHRYAIDHQNLHARI